MSVLELYLSKESEYKTNLNIIKYPNAKVKVNFTMNNDINETTSFFVGYDNFIEKENLKDFLMLYKGNLIILDEKYEFDKISETCYYCITLSNGRVLSFKNFLLQEVNNIRNLIYNINYKVDEIKINLDEEEKNGYYNHGILLLGQTGFATFLTFFIVIFIIVIVFIITLLTFKKFI